eukprot:gene10553-7506_t
MAKVNLLMETLQWLDQLDYQESAIPLDLFGSPIRDIKRTQYSTSQDDASFSALDETFLRDTTDIDADKMRRFLSKWRKWVIQRKVAIVTHNDKKPFVISKGMQLVRVPAWRNFLLLTKGIRHWHRSCLQRQAQRKADIQTKRPRYLTFNTWRRRARWPTVAVQRTQFSLRRSLRQWHHYATLHRAVRRRMRLLLQVIIRQLLALWRSVARARAQRRRVHGVALQYLRSHRHHHFLAHWEVYAWQRRHQRRCMGHATSLHRRQQLRSGWWQWRQQVERRRRCRSMVAEAKQRQRHRAWQAWRLFLALSRPHLQAKWHRCQASPQRWQLQRARLRYTTGTYRRVLAHWQCVMRQQGHWRRRLRVFRRLHPLPECSPVRRIFVAWRDEYLSYAARLKRQVTRVVQQVARTRLAMCWMKWRAARERRRRMTHATRRVWRWWRGYTQRRRRLQLTLQRFCATQAAHADALEVAVPVASWAAQQQQQQQETAATVDASAAEGGGAPSSIRIRRLLIRGSAAEALLPSGGSSVGSDDSLNQSTLTDVDVSFDDVTTTAAAVDTTLPCAYHVHRAAQADTRRMRQEGERGYLQQFDHALALAQVYRQPASSSPSKRRQPQRAQKASSSKAAAGSSVAVSHDGRPLAPPSQRSSGGVRSG